MKNYSIEAIYSLLSNPQSFKEEILNSQGYILFCGKNHGIEFDKNLLLETISAYSIRFLTENYSLDESNFSEEEIKIIKEYIEEPIKEKKSYKEILKNYTKEDLIKELQLSPINFHSENELRTEKLNKFKKDITFEYFKMEKESLIQILVQPYEIQNMQSLYKTDRIIGDIIKNLTVEEFLSLEESFLIKHPALFNMNEKLFKHDEVKALYKKAVNNFYDENRHNYRKKADIRDYQQYIFTSNELDFVKELLQNSEYPEYRIVNNIQGLNNVWTHLEFFEEYNVFALNDLVEKDIEENIEKIQNKLIQHQANKKIMNWESIIDYRISDELFIKIFTPDMLERMIKEVGQFKFIKNTDYEKANKINHINFGVIDIIAKDDTLMNHIQMTEVLSEIIYIHEHRHSAVSEEFINNTEIIYNNTLQYGFKTEQLFQDKYTNYYQNNMFDVVLKYKENPTINYLYLLLSINKEIKQGKELFPGYIERYTTVIRETINEIIPKLNGNEVKIVCDYFKIEVSSKILNAEIESGKYENNFLNYEEKGLEKLPTDQMIRLLTISPEIRQYVLDNNITLIKEGENKQNHILKNKPLMANILYILENKSEDLLEFTSAYINKNKEIFFNNYMKDIMIHPCREKLIKIDTVEQEKKEYVKLMESLYEREEIIKQRESIISKNKKGYETIEFEALLNKEEELVVVINNCVKNISYDVAKIKINELIEKKSYTELMFFIKSKKVHIEIVANHINQLSFNDLLKALENEEVLMFINEVGAGNKNNTSKIIEFNKNYTQAENKYLANLLLPYIGYIEKEVDALTYISTVSIKPSPEDVLSLFNSTAKGFAKEFVIEHDVKNLFFTHKYIPKTSKDGLIYNNGKHIDTFYSNEEVIKAYKKMEKQYGSIFNNNDSNLNYSYMLSSNYEGREEEYKKLLQLSVSDPIMYLVFSHEYIISNFIHWGDKEDQYKNKDVALAAYINENMDLDILIKAIEKIAYITEEYSEKLNKIHMIKRFSKIDNVEELKETEQLNLSYIAEELSNILKMTYYSTQFVKKGESDFISFISDENSEKLFHAIITHVPLYLLTLNSLGNIKDIKSHYIENIDKYDENIMEKLLLNKKLLISKHWNLDHPSIMSDQTNKDVLLHIIENVVSYMIEKEKLDIIEKTIYVLEESSFEKNKPWNKRIPEFTNSLINAVADNARINKLLKNGKNMIELKKKIEYININMNEVKKERKFKKI